MNTDQSCDESALIFLMAGATVEGDTGSTAVRALAALLCHPMLDCRRAIQRHRVLASIALSDGTIKLGWIPATSAQGDAACYILGAPFPFLLRESQGKAGYTLLGDACLADFKVEDLLGRIKVAQEWSDRPREEDLGASNHIVAGGQGTPDSTSHPSWSDEELESQLQDNDMKRLAVLVCLDTVSSWLSLV